jgi:acyl-CoA thioesterase
MPGVTPPHALKSFRGLWPDAPDDVRFWDNIESRIVYPDRIFNETDAFPPHHHEWYRFQPAATFEDPFADAGRLAILLDTFAWPASALPYPRNSRKHQGVNLDVVAWFHEPAPDAEWLLCDYDATVAGGGQAVAAGRVWTEDGRLAASGGAQLLCVPMPEPPG